MRWSTIFAENSEVMRGRETDDEMPTYSHFISLFFVIVFSATYTYMQQLPIGPASVRMYSQFRRKRWQKFMFRFYFWYIDFGRLNINCAN